MSKTSFQFTTEDKHYSTAQRAWLRAAYRKVYRLLEKNGTFTSPNFWADSKQTDYPRPTLYDIDNRVLGRVIRQVIAHGHMTDSNPGWGKKVPGSSTFKPVYNSNIMKSKTTV